MEFNSVNLDRYLRSYYKSIYPVDLICKWISYNQEDYLMRREIVFILKDDIHIRYLSFNNSSQFSDMLSSKTPYKVDIGAVYNYPPKDRHKYTDFHTEERELVFDIDLTDYDGIRTCCSGTNVCSKCWRFVTISVKVIEMLLKEHFGFKNLLWVFSGRRGIHCWVSDERARKINNFGREAISKYIKFDKNGPAITKQRVHPMIEHSYQTIMNSGELDAMIIEQGWLENEQNWSKVLSFCEDHHVRDILHNELSDLESAELRWKLLKLRFDETERKKKLESGDSKLPFLPNDFAKNFLKIFVLSYTFPKLDEKVTSTINHLLKSPFSVHPKSGYIAVPIDPNTVHKFALDKVPRVDKLSTELRKIQSESDGDRENVNKIHYEQTELSPYIEIFKKFLDIL